MVFIHSLKGMFPSNHAPHTHFSFLTCSVI